MKRLISVLMVLLICLLCSCKSKEETVSSNIESTAYSQEQNGNISSKSNLNTSSNNSALKGESHPETTNTKETEEQYVFQELQNDDFEDFKELLCEETVKCYSFNGDCYRMPVFSRLTYTDKKSGITLPYVLYVPKQKEAGGCPVYLFLHGAGERGDTYNHYYSQIQRAFSVAGDYLSRAIVIAPQCPYNGWWDLDGYNGGYECGNLGAAKHLLDEVIDTYAANRNRIYVTGLSMGGFATWDLITRYQNYFAAAAPLCGGGDKYSASSLKTTPIWIYHGTVDQTVSYYSSLGMFNAIADAGGKLCKMISLSGVAHNAWDYAYADRSLFCWIFAQDLKSNQSITYSGKLSFEITDPYGRTVVADPDIKETFNMCIAGKEYIAITLTPTAATALKNAYKNHMGETFGVYLLGQKLYDFKAKGLHSKSVFYVEKTIDDDPTYYAALRVLQSTAELNFIKNEIDS